ncbi:hypothetical protein Purlil1_14371 [Purpureocillium lilacinum]|uniref:F-box-like domain-containing protein n=1 Tax=Purpureocillium lilacinum TaxID=33203 RepID=A0ABR0BBG9_PURLI|nr:hypothetical protein Purlil1_14371 [Purpureocillium lilacinum]
MDITSYARGLACVTRSPSLRSITLRGCLGWDSFLQSLIEPGSKLAINTLEVYQPVRFWDPDDADEVVKAFLESVDGLEILHLSLPSPCDTKACWRTMARHTSALRQLVYHIRGVNLDDESRHVEEEMDMSDMSLISDLFFDGDSESDDEFDGGGFDDNETDDSASEQPSLGHDPWFDERSPNPLGDLQLECIGLACRPARLREVLDPFTKKDCLRIVHIRQSGSDIRCFGSWVFGRKNLYRFPQLEPPLTKSRRDIPFLGHEVVPGWISPIPGQSDHAVTATVLNDEFRDFADWVFGADGIASLEMIAWIQTWRS